MTDRADVWRWGNVPIPEPHVAGLVLGGALHALFPWQATRNLQLLRLAGWTLLGAGVLLIAWTVWAARTVDVERPSELLTTGPFAYSRNPMYVAWTALYVGIALVVNTVWPFVLLPAVIVATHIIVRREERSLDTAFGDDYREYTDDVRRYL